MSDPINLDQTLFNFIRKDPQTVRYACEGTMVFGSTGSGKSSGSIKTITKSFLEFGCGGLILTVKPTDLTDYRRWIDEAGRTDDLIVFGDINDSYRFNFMDYEAQRPGEGGGLSRNLVKLFHTVMELGGVHRGGGEDSYWQNSADQCLNYIIELALLSRGKASVQLLYDILTSAAQSAEELASEEWQAKSEMFQCLYEAEERSAQGELDGMQGRDLEVINRYFTVEWINLAERPRSIITNMLTSVMYPFLTGHLRELFCTETTIVPEMIWEDNKILCLNLNLKSWGELGKIAQGIIKRAFQNAVEVRNIDLFPQPCFLLIDECQHFIGREDFTWLTTARSSRTMTLLATQSYSNLLAVLGGGNSARAKAEADGLLTNCNTKIFHAQSDTTTNLYAADLIGRVYQDRVSVSRTSRMMDGMGQTTTNVSDNLSYLVEPHEFTRLKKGSELNKNEVTAIVHQSGRKFESNNDQAFTLVTFKQD